MTNREGSYMSTAMRTAEAIEDAASFAGLLITTDAMIAEKPKKDVATAMPGGGIEY